MALTKKKPKVQASEVAVGHRTLDNMLVDLAEQIKANDAKYAERSAQNDEMSRIALQTIAAVSQDLRAFAQDFRTLAQRTDDRLTTLEKAVAAG